MSGDNLMSNFFLNHLHILLTELISQEDSGSYHNDGLGRHRGIQEPYSIHDSNQSLTTASRHDDLTLASVSNLVEGGLLMGTKLDQGTCAVDTNSIAPTGVL